MSRKKRNKWESARLNNLTYIDVYNQLKNLALNVFEWENIPSTIDERFLELNLYEKGYCLYFDDEIIGNLVLPCTIGGRLDLYDIPYLRQAYASNGYNRQLYGNDSVIIYNNYIHTPTHMTIEMFARRIYEIERTIDVNVKAQKVL